MVLCLLALPIFAFLGLFSLKYRKLSKDALQCLFRTVTLRKCESGLDDRIKAQITGKLLKFSPKTAGFFYKNYKLLSWLILMLFLWSLYQSSIGIYNYSQYGNCNGPEDVGFCIFDPTGENNGLSDIDIAVSSNITYPLLEDDDPIIGNKDAKLTIIEFGCYACPYTKKAEPIIKEVLEYYKGSVNLQFKTIKIPKHMMSYQSALAANCAKDQGKYLEYHDLLFNDQENMSNDLFLTIAEGIDLDMIEFEECLVGEKYKKEIDDDTLMGLYAGVHGTPTFFINKQMIVGPKPFKTFKNIIDEELKK